MDFTDGGRWTNSTCTGRQYSGTFPGLDDIITGIYRRNDNPTIMEGILEFDSKSGCRRYPPGLLPETREAMDTLTDEEIAQLKVWRDNVTNEFVCIGFEWNGKVTKWADERRALAVAAMEKQIRWEEGNAR